MKPFDIALFRFSLLTLTLLLGPIGCFNLPSRSGMARAWMSSDLPRETSDRGPNAFGIGRPAQFVQPKHQREAELALAREPAIQLSREQAEHFCGPIPQPQIGTPYLVRSLHELHVYTILRVNQQSDGDVWVYAMGMPHWFEADCDPYPAVAWLERPPKKMYVTFGGMPW